MTAKLLIHHCPTSHLKQTKKRPDFQQPNVSFIFNIKGFIMTDEKKNNVIKEMFDATREEDGGPIPLLSASDVSVL